MKHYIEGKEVTEENIGDPVTYIPHMLKEMLVTLILKEGTSLHLLNIMCL